MTNVSARANRLSMKKDNNITIFKSQLGKDAIQLHFFMKMKPFLRTSMKRCMTQNPWHLIIVVKCARDCMKPISWVRKFVIEPMRLVAEMRWRKAGKKNSWTNASSVHILATWCTSLAKTITEPILNQFICNIFCSNQFYFSCQTKVLTIHPFLGSHFFRPGINLHRPNLQHWTHYLLVITDQKRMSEGIRSLLSRKPHKLDI